MWSGVAVDKEAFDRLLHHMRGRPWTVEEDALLRIRYPEEGCSKELCRDLNRTKKAIQYRVGQELKIHRNGYSFWTPEQDDALRKGYKTLSSEELIKLCGNRIWVTICCRASKLGLGCPGSWSEKEDEIMRQYYSDGNWGALQRELPNKTRGAISKRSQKLGICMKSEVKRNHLRHSQRIRGQRVFDSHGKIVGSVITRALSNAQQRGLDSSLLDGSLDSMEYLNSIAHDCCAISGLPLKYKISSTDTAFTASLDRIDSSKGYVKGNVQWVHKTINNMKNDLSDKEFITFCRAVTRRQEGSNNT